MLRSAQNATIAKAHAMWGKRLRSEDYTRLMNCREISDAAEYLKSSTHYGDVLTGIDTLLIHRGFLEALLKKHTFLNFSRLYGFLKPGRGTMGEQYIARSELSEIFSMLRHLNAGVPEEYISTMPSYLVGRTSYDIIALAKCRTREDILNVLSATPYAAIIRRIPVNADGNPDYTACEVALRTQYYRAMLDRAGKIARRSERNTLLRQIGVQVDLINIINAYRLKAFFNADAESIKKNIFPFSGRISPQAWQILLNAENGEDFLSLLGNTPYGKQLLKIEGAYFEMCLSKFRVAIAKSDFMNTRDTSVCLYCIQYLFSIELENVIKIIEGIHYRKQPSEIAALLVL